MTKPEVPAPLWPSQYPPSLGPPLPFLNLIPKPQFTTTSFQLGITRCFLNSRGHFWASSQPFLPSHHHCQRLSWKFIFLDQFTFQTQIKEGNKAKTDSVERSSSERGCLSPWEEPASEAHLLSQVLQREMGGEPRGAPGFGTFMVLKTPLDSDVADCWMVVLSTFQKPK